MLLRAFPAAEGSSCCLSSGDWPLGPHEILFHPRDLEKLRVPAFGYVEIHPNSSSSSSGSGGRNSSSNSSSRTTTTNSTNEHSSARVGIYENVNIRGGEKGRRKGNNRSSESGVEGAHLTFCRAVPDDCLEPGEMKLPVWILRAAGVRPTQHLRVSAAPTSSPPLVPAVAAAEQAVEKEENLLKCSVELSIESSKQRNHPLTSTDGPTKQDFNLPELLPRAIARRISGCMVGIGSLLAAEVFGETVVLRVVTIAAISSSRKVNHGSNRVTAPYYRAGKIYGMDDGNEQRGALAEERRHQNQNNASEKKNEPPLASKIIISSTTEIAVVQPGEREEGMAGHQRWSQNNNKTSTVGGSSSGCGGGRGGHPDDVPMRERFDPHCDGRNETWARRAPGLESALGELHSLILLSVGGLKGEVKGGPDDDDNSSREQRNDVSLAHFSTLSPYISSGGAQPQSTQPPLPPPPPPPKAEPAFDFSGEGRRKGEDNNSDDGRGKSRNANCFGWRDILPAGIVLCGPSGVGKTLALDVLSEDLRDQHGVHVIRLLGPQIIAGFSHGGGSSSGGKTAGAAARLLLGSLAISLAEARARSPAVLIIDELDALFDAAGGDEGAAPLGEGAKATAALLEALDRVSAIEDVTVVGATRRSPGGRGGAGWAGLQEETGGIGGEGAIMPAAFRKPGRFDRCVVIGPPTQRERERILRVLLAASPKWELEPIAVEDAPSNDSVITENASNVKRGGGDGSEDFLKAELDCKRKTNLVTDQHVHDNHKKELRSREDQRGVHEHINDGVAATSQPIPLKDAIIVGWAKRLGSVTPGMVAGDLERLVRTARARATQRRQNTGRAAPSLHPWQRNVSPAARDAPCPSTQQQRQQQHTTLLTWRDAMGAVGSTVPRSLRGMDVASSGGAGDSSAPTWSSVGGFSKARRRLQRLVQWPWLHPEAFARMGVSAPAGALLYGPSGCGKSLVAQVLATECLANFVWVRSSELLSRYLGETEAKLRALFARARAAAPCILFLDELDAITAKRGGGGDGSGGAGGVHMRVLSTLLNEMDGVATTSSSSGSSNNATGGGGVLVLAATNRKDAIDAALLRPGRLHESVEFGMPGKEDREGVLRVHAQRLPLSDGVDLARLSQDDVSGGLSCADIEASCRDAAMMAVRADLHGAREVRPEHLRKALEERVAGRLKTRRFTFSMGQASPPAT